MIFPILGVSLIVLGASMLYLHLRPPKGDEVPLTKDALERVLRRQDMWKGYED